MANTTNISNAVCLSTISNLDTAFSRSGLNIPGVAGIAAIYAVIFAIGIYGSCHRRKLAKQNQVEEVVLASRNMNEVIGVLSLTATWAGGDYVVGTSEFLFNPDWGLIWCQAPVYISLALVVTGVVFAKKMWISGYTTILDPYQEKFGHLMMVLLYLVNLFSEVSLATICFSVLGSTINVIVGVSYLWGVVISAIISLIYTLMGGLASVSYTDVLQCLLMFVGLWLAVPFAYLEDAVSPISETAFGGWLGEPLQGPWISHYLDNVFLLMLGAIPQQILFQRVLSQKSAEKASKFCIIAGFVSLAVIAAPVVIGAIAASTDWNATEYHDFGTIPVSACDYPLALPLVMRFLTPLPVAVIALGAVTAGSMSTSDSVILSCSTMFAHNIYQPARNGIAKRLNKTEATENEVVWVLKIGMVVVATLTTVTSLTIKSIAILMSLCVDLPYCLAFPQLVCVLYVPWVNSYGAIIGYFVSLALRFMGGEPYMDLEPTFRYPWYDEESGIQRFPYKTLIVIIHFVILLSISWITTQAANRWKWVKKVDKHLFKAFVAKGNQENYVVIPKADPYIEDVYVESFRLS